MLSILRLFYSLDRYITQSVVTARTKLLRLPTNIVCRESDQFVVRVMIESIICEPQKPIQTRKTGLGNWPIFEIFQIQVSLILPLSILVKAMSAPISTEVNQVSCRGAIR